MAYKNYDMLSLQQKVNEIDNKCEKDYVDEKVNDINSSLEDNSNKLYIDTKQNSAPYDYNGAIISWVDDDATTKFLTNLKPVLDSHNIKCSIATITANVGTNGYMGIDDLMTLQNEGFEIVSHSKTHSPSIYKNTNDLSAVSDLIIDNDLKESFNWLKSNGFKGYDKLVFPWGGFGDETVRYKNIASKYYKYSLNAFGGYNTTPVDNRYLNRYFINKTMDLDTIKNRIDDAINNKGWLIISSHSGSDTEFDENLFNNVLDYIVSKNVPILTLEEAIKYKGNAISIGEFTNASNRLHISVNGDNNLPIEIRNDAWRYSENDVIGAFQKDKITRFISLNSNSFGVAGIMEVFRSSSLYYSYSTFTPYDSNEIYMRKWNDRKNKWDDWSRINEHSFNITVTPVLSGYSLTPSLDTSLTKTCKQVVGTISLQHSDLTGNISQNDILANFDKTFAPKSPVLIKLIVVTKDGTFSDLYASIELVDDKTVLKSQTSLNNNNIRWIVANVNYSTTF